MSNVAHVELPVSCQVVQRDAINYGQIPIRGTFHGDASDMAIAVRCLTSGDEWEGRSGWSWVYLGNDRKFRGSMRVPAGGWYEVQVCGRQAEEFFEVTSVERVGVGEIFITAGQSNSANHGRPVQMASDGRIVALGEDSWDIANDPQPIATSDGGSPWPLLGKRLLSKLDVPIGFASVGVGGSEVRQWDPDIEGSLYPRLKSVLERVGRQGARAVLWHQGESDTVYGTSADEYAEILSRVIIRSREDAGFEIPWIIARVSFVSDDHIEKQPEILAGQRQVVDRGLALEGPTTDDLLGEEFRYDLLHFNQHGLAIHADRWAEAIIQHFFS